MHENVNFSCIIVCAKMSRYFYYTYCLQEELTYFDLKELTNFGLKVSAQFEPKNHTRNIINIHGSVQNYINFKSLIL